MSNVNEGAQEVFWKFRFPVTGIHFHKVLSDIILEGIFLGMELTIVDPSTIQINSGSVVFQGTFNLSDKVSTKINFNLPITKPAPQSISGENEIVYMTYNYEEVVQNFAGVFITNINTFLASPPDNSVILGTIIYDGLGNIISIDQTLRMERAVAHMNEFGLLTNKNANKFLYTNSIIDKDFTLPTNGNSNLAVIREMTVETGVTLTIPNGEVLIILEEIDITSGLIENVFVLNGDTAVYNFPNATTVIANLAQYLPNVFLYTDLNNVYIRNNSGISINTKFNFIQSKK